MIESRGICLSGGSIFRGIKGVRGAAEDNAIVYVSVKDGMDR